MKKYVVMWEDVWLFIKQGPKNEKVNGIYFWTLGRQNDKAVLLSFVPYDITSAAPHLGLLCVTLMEAHADSPIPQSSLRTPPFWQIFSTFLEISAANVHLEISNYPNYANYITTLTFNA